MTKPESAPTADERRIEKKWGKELIDAGWLAIPDVLLLRQHAIGIDAKDLAIILQIAVHWWEPGNHPFVSKVTVARRLGLTPRTVQRRIARLEKDGLITRQQRRDGGSKTNIYRFDGLIRAAIPLAQEVIKEREERKAKKSEQQRRKRPALRVVRGAGA